MINISKKIENRKNTDRLETIWQPYLTLSVSMYVCCCFTSDVISLGKAASKPCSRAR